MARKLFLLILVFFISNTAFSADTDSIAQGIFHTTMSPFCPGRLLSDCPSSQAAELKQLIRDELSKGTSSDQIRAELISKFGDQVSAEPLGSGFGAVAWWTPVLFVIIGVIVFTVWFKNSKVEDDSNN
jgi:cytochrome c-type biogenesis protein CcmH